MATAGKGKIDCYVDCTSPYSRYAMIHLRRNRRLLESHGVEVEFHPVFLGGINVGTGETIIPSGFPDHYTALDASREAGLRNKPPFTNRFKAKYSSFDTPRSAKYFGVPYAPAPDFFPILSILPQRCMIYVKDHYPREMFEQTVLQLWVHLFNKATDISRPEHLSQALAEHIDAKDVPTILAAADTPKYKQALTDNTQKAMDRGAFGAPWLWVSNRHGESQPFFGADRFHLVWQFLDIPFSDLAIKEKPKL